MLPNQNQHKFMSSKNGKAVVRIRTPHPHDVLSGRGGGINAHPGNKRFRNWIGARKEAYNLASNKQDKANVSMEVLNLVRKQNPPGRFLAKEENANFGPGVIVGVTGYWLEVDENKAIAKTSQALREGAPKIKAQHGVSAPASRSRPSSAELVSQVRDNAAETGVSHDLGNPSAKRHKSNSVPVPNSAASPSQRFIHGPVLSHPEHFIAPLQDMANLPRLSSPQETVKALASAVKSAAWQHDMQTQRNGAMGPPMPRPASGITAKLFGSREAASTMVADAQRRSNPNSGSPLHYGIVPGAPQGPWHPTAPQSMENRIPFEVLSLPASATPFVSGTPPLVSHSPRSSCCSSSSDMKLEEPLNFSQKKNRGFIAPLARSSSSSSSNKNSPSFYRSHSLATSDDNFDAYGEEFTNPFDDDLYGLGVAAESNPFSSAMPRNSSFSSMHLDDGKNDKAPETTESKSTSSVRRNDVSGKDAKPFQGTKPIGKHDTNEVSASVADSSSAVEAKRTEQSDKDAPLPPCGVEEQKSNLSNISQFGGLSTFSNLGSSASSLSRRLIGSSSPKHTKPPSEIKTS
jgi:hypothetical protein